MTKTNGIVCEGSGRIGDWKKCPVCGRDVWPVGFIYQRVPRHNGPYIKEESNAAST